MEQLMIGFLSRHAKPVSLIGGFLFGVMGAAWSFFVVNRLGEEMTQLSNARADMTRQMQTLNSIASDYFIANQQGDLIFILTQQENARQDLSRLVYKGNILDRATPVRNMIGALAMAGQLDYRQTYDAYEKLNDETRASLSFDNFTRLKQAEKAIIVKGQERVPLLLGGLLKIEKAINENEAAQKKNRMIGIVSSILGNLLLLVANLIVEKN
jgi:hypothetical protein